MGGRLWRGIGPGLTHLRWPLAGLAALVVILACVFVIPQWLVRWELGAPARTLTPADRAKAINDVRATLLQGIGGAVILLGAYFTYRQLQTGREQLQIAQQGQVTERFTRAIDQLGHTELDVRLGGIYALERIANDSPNDRTTIAEVLTAFIRGHAPWPPRLPGQYLAEAPIEQVPELQVRAPDVQAALTVLGRRQPLPKLRGRLDLEGTDLRKARLEDADLRQASLFNTNLQEAVLDSTNLQEAILYNANLQGAMLDNAQLQGRASTAPSSRGRTSTEPSFNWRSSTPPTSRGLASTMRSSRRRVSRAPTSKGRASSAPTSKRHPSTAPTSKGRSLRTPTFKGRSSMAPTSGRLLLIRIRSGLRVSIQRSLVSCCMTNHQTQQVNQRSRELRPVIKPGYCGPDARLRPARSAGCTALRRV